MKHALLRTFAGRVVLAGLAIRIADYIVALAIGRLPTLLAVVDVIAALAIACGGVYFLLRGLVAMNRQLLWRLRWKLVISYVFIGLVPTLLVVVFFVLGGVLLFFNFSAYMVRSEFRAITDRARSIAHSAALEIEKDGGRDMAGVLRRQNDAAAVEFPGLSMAVVPTTRTCAKPSTAAAPPRGLSGPLATGPWAHVPPPTVVPAWISCDGFAGVFLYSRGAVALSNTVPVVRAVAFPESTNTGAALIVDIDVNPGVRSELRRAIGVQLENPIAWEDVDGDVSKPRILPIAGRTRASDTTLAPAPAVESVPPLAAITYLEYRDWTTGDAARVTLATRLGIPEVYGKVSAAPGAGNIVILVLEGVGGLFIVFEIVALAFGLALAKSITGSVHELFEGTEQVRRGDFTHKIAVKADDQLGQLARSFNSMTASIEDLLSQAAEKKRLEEELRIAHEIQMSLLPQGSLRMPGLSVTALCVPAREVGGDYFDFLPLGESRLGVLIADVSGKGTSAALYMAELKGLMLALSRNHASPRELLIQADRIIAPHLDARSFITVTYAIIDLDARTMTYARAGHTPLIYLPAAADDDGTRRAKVLTPSGMVLGLKLDRGEIFERLLEESTIPLKTGDLCVLFTDGISEAMTLDDDFFGDDRLCAILEAHPDLPSEELRERVFREVAAFVGDAPQHDDMTMILLRVEEKGQGAL